MTRLQPSVLLVDDEEDVLDAMADMLRACEFAVIPSNNANDALAKLASGSPVHLLVTDVRMPVMDGFELARETRKYILDLPVVYVSGWVEHLPNKIIQGPLLLKPVRAESLCLAAKQNARPPA